MGHCRSGQELALVNSFFITVVVRGGRHWLVLIGQKKTNRRVLVGRRGDPGSYPRLRAAQNYGMTSILAGLGNLIKLPTLPYLRSY